MFTKFARALKWTRIVKLYHQNRFEEFATALKDYEMLHSLDDYERALKAFTLLQNGDSEASKYEFGEVFKKAQLDDSEKGRYLALYSSAMIDSIGGNQNALQRRKAEADAIGCGILYKTMLPF